MSLREGNEHVPHHCGGHFGWAQMDLGVLRYMIELIDPKTGIDVGAGIGEMVTRMNDNGIQAVGIDGDINCCANHPRLIHHDYARGPISLGEFDLGWSVEFLEHVCEHHMANYMATFKGCRWLAITAAPPGRGGHHHVNCQWQAYWVKHFDAAGFDFREKETAEARAESIPWLLMDRKSRGTNAFGTLMIFRRR